MDSLSWLPLDPTSSNITVWAVGNTTINAAVVVTYVALTRLTKVAVPEYIKINRSLNLMILLHISAWLLPIVFTLAVSLFHPCHLFSVAVQNTVIILWNITMVAPFFIYYFRSTLYNRELRSIFRLRGWKVNVASVASS
ncbi:hypothetical protein QR680_014515 [Steinernema hermaphroditum]|uniref:Uncharacterized protein n=1 Tax=Steinernema hermaphroditum TaxID=289476 RepID=A0AA39IBS5_9BILA|nr:hypothetical protein QR680_014515 [Steinernema hermaphroditum]